MGIEITIKSEDVNILQILKQVGSLSYESFAFLPDSQVLNMKSA